MKTVRFLPKVMITFVLITCFTIRVSGQTNESLKDKEDKQITQEDLKSVLEILKVEIFKYKVNFPQEKKYKVILYQQEFEKRKKIKDFTIWGTTSPFRTVESGKEIYKPLEQIKIVTKNNTSEFLLNVSMGDFRLAGNQIKIDTVYKNPHACMSFKLPESYSVGDTIPLLLIGSFWDSTSKDGKVKIQRFCWGIEGLKSDFSDVAFDEMPHYFIIGIRVEGDN
jgi:hypothetical protein